MNLLSALAMLNGMFALSNILIFIETGNPANFLIGALNVLAVAMHFRGRQK